MMSNDEPDKKHRSSTVKMNAREQEENTRRRRVRCSDEKLLSSSSSSSWWSQKSGAGVSGQSSPRTSDPLPATASRSTAFGIAYGRLGFPLATVHGVVDGQRLRWLVPPELVDYDAYLPVLADGLRERPMPFGACATFGLWELLALDCPGDRVLSALPKTVFPIRRALDVGPRDWPTTVRALKSLQKLSSAGRKGLVGPAMVPYYRQLLSPINRYQHTSAGVIATDGLDANVMYNLSNLCHDTLCVLERTGGANAYSSIKSVVPTYQSCITVVGCTTSGSLNRIKVCNKALQ
ncbi:parkin coregulated gene protein homolog [Acyrthosiphon pisum]|uniref:Uncharacterized protein n=1 Tax=Acyrthosiphon pisum TaxID=7029 RepID=A0A8R2FCB4_ACYPI|nr:parkin coregulated gene protein homolog [Acyrthosiphon pisum]|eukprot:XP_008187683.1 PREDICTED: parkin coregulated gene protein homolog [Acyrthosiphon pisum]